MLPKRMKAMKQIKIKTYTIKKGGLYRPYQDVRKLYAANWWEACEEFRKWALSWLEDSDSEFAEAAKFDIMRCKHPSNLTWDGWNYTIERIK